MCCLTRKAKMTKILVVGLAVILAAAGSARADGANGQGSTSSATSGSSGSSGSAHSSGGAAAHSSGSGAVASARSSGSGSVQQGTVAPARSSGSNVVHQGAVAPSSRSGSAPVVRNYLTNVNVQNGVQANLPANWRVQRPLDRSELLARQALYLNRNRVNTVQGTSQSPANTSQFRGDGQVSTDVPTQGIIQKRHHRDDQDASRNGTNVTNGTGGTQMTSGTQGTNSKPIPATNAGLRGGKRVLNFNNANTMNFTDACRRHRDHHDRDWWRNHCHTIVLIGGGFY